MYGHLKESHDKLQNDVTNYRIVTLSIHRIQLAAVSKLNGRF